MHSSTLLAALVSLLVPSSLAYSTQSGIISPANGTALKPGQSFDFLYDLHADYCMSSFNYTVWMFTSDPRKFGMGSDDAIGTGRFLGRFQQANYPAVPYPRNPPPAQLTMPDFSHGLGGFAGGQSASNKKVYLAVLEEWSPCAPTMGENLSLTWNTLNYNVTK